MSFLHCHSCGWSQDDFYSVDGYNPARSLKDWMDKLCSNDLDEQFSKDHGFIKEYGDITTREVIALEFERYAKNIREMKYITSEQWEKAKDTAVCPKCGKKNLDID